MTPLTVINSSDSTKRELCETCPGGCSRGSGVSMVCDAKYHSACQLNAALKRQDSECPLNEFEIPELKRKLEIAVAAGAAADAERISRKIVDVREHVVEFRNARPDPPEINCQGRMEKSVAREITDYQATYRETRSHDDGPRGVRGPHVVYISTGKRPEKRPADA